MNEILIVPDVHGRKFWEKALDYKGEIVFLGDYTDPYPKEKITNKEAYNGLLEIVEFKRQNPERVTLLIGNHEMHYYNEEYQVSRFSKKYYKRYHTILTNGATRNFFQIAKQIGKYLFVHAGLSKGWYNRHQDQLKLMGENIETQLNLLFIQDKDVFNELPNERGGYYEHGSPIWSDIWELKRAKEPFDENIIQIVGHNKINTPNPIEYNNTWLTDNQKLYLLRKGRLEEF